MANALLVIGKSGSGKSTSIRNLDPKRTFLINAIGKELPFPGHRGMYTPWVSATGRGNMLSTHDPLLIQKALKTIPVKCPEVTTIIIDDLQYMMSFELMARAKEKGYEKYTEIAYNTFNVIRTAQELPPHLTVIFLSHSEIETENGVQMTKVKTVGKMLDSQIVLEGLFTVVLYAVAEMENKVIRHHFITQSDGTTTCKSPMGMFPSLRIDNDLAQVLNYMNKYGE